MNDNLHECASVATIFEEAPYYWGGRGNPYLWAEMKEAFAQDVLPYPAKDFYRRFLFLFEALTGAPLARDCAFYSEKHAHGGISSGLITGEFWCDLGLPLLLYRVQPLTVEGCAIQADWNALYTAVLSKRYLLLPKAWEFERYKGSVADLAERLLPSLDVVSRMQYIGYMETAVRRIVNRMRGKFDRNLLHKDVIRLIGKHRFHKDTAQNDPYCYMQIREMFPWMEDINAKRSICCII